MTEDLREVYDLPADFRIADASHGDRVTAADGTELAVLVTPTGDERYLVHADIVAYNGVLDHPMTTGVVGFAAVVVAFIAPVLGGYHAAAQLGGLVKTILPAFAGVAGGWLLANLILYRTFVGDWVFRFLEWNDHRDLLLVRGESA